MKIPYFSRDPAYKTPFGAAKTGEDIIFRLFLPLDCSQAFILWCKDGCGEINYRFWKTKQKEEDGHWWECLIRVEEPGLYYYRFTFDTPFGHNVLTCGEGGKALMNPGGGSYQLTVYDASFETPSWLPGGIVYQIFPDRFCASGTPKKKVPADRYLHSEFAGTPAHTLEKIPCRLNNDYFGGDLKGIEQKLPYLKELGVTCLYLNPIFEAHANHRYNTADYMKIDPLLGTAADFKSLCKAAHALDIRVVLDGVFSHTGSDSVYFNSEKRYPLNGAVNTPDSPYRSWYTFTDYPHKYHSWWGFTTLPEVKETDPSYLDFIAGKEGVAAHWLKMGADGWRLDVADELPDQFLETFRKRVKAQNPQALIWGEVWEDATTKISYGKRRSYLQGYQLDSVMNYPFMNAVLSFVRKGDGKAFTEQVMTLLEHYPAPAVHTLMNHLGTHDTPRLMTALAGEPAAGRDRNWQAAQSLTKEQRELGERLVKLACVLSYTLPGVPCVYYGDEVGMEGYTDPFNRAPFPQKAPSPSLLSFYKKMGKIRTACPVLKQGAMIPVEAHDNVVSFLRKDEKGILLTAVNRGDTPVDLPIPQGYKKSKVLLGKAEENTCHLDALDAVLVVLTQVKSE